MRYPISFVNQGQKLLGVVHRPDSYKSGDPLLPAVVILHGFTGTKVEPHRLFVKLAEALAAAGFLALRFDFRGSGDSEGDFEDMTFLGEVSDAGRAIDYLLAAEPVDPDRIGVLGLSLGGAVAAVLTGRDPRIKTTVLWAAAADLQTMGQRMLSESPMWIEEKQVWDRGGNLVGRHLAEEIIGIFPAEEIKNARGPVLVIHGDGDEIVPISHAHQYISSLNAAGITNKLEVIAGADHTFNRYAWEKSVIEMSAAWFRENLA